MPYAFVGLRRLSKVALLIGATIAFCFWARIRATKSDG